MPEPTEITAVLMAAGVGKRLLPLTSDRSKAMVEVAGAPLIDYGIAFCREAHIQRIAVVGGSYFEMLAAHVRSVAPEAVLVENRDFEMQNATSLLRVLEKVSGHLLVCDVDYIRTKVQAALAGRVYAETTLFVSRGKTSDADVMYVALDAEGAVTGMSKILKEYQATSAGMFFVPSHRVVDLTSAAETAIERKGAKDARVEDALLVLVERGIPVLTQDLGSRDWAEVDTPEERDAAERFARSQRVRLAIPPVMS